MSARSISMLVETSLFVLGHWNINFVNGTSPVNDEEGQSLCDSRQAERSGNRWVKE